MLCDSELPPIALFAWCENVSQTRLIVCGEHSHAHNESRVWRLENPSDKTAYYLKSHRRAHKWEQEAAFYEEFLPLTSPSMQAQTPRLLAAREETEGVPPALLFSALPGVPLESIPGLSPDAERRAWEHAGRYLAQFHALPLPLPLAGEPWFGAIQRNGKSRPTDPPTSPARLMVQDLTNALAPLPGEVSPLTDAEKTLGREGLEMASVAFANEPPVLCQRDFSPRNWLADAQTGAWVGVIDFEHTRRDVRIADLAKWWDGPFLTRPDLEEAFWAGYGPWPDEAARFDSQLRVARIVQALSQIKWARAHDDIPFETRGHEAADRLGRG